MSACMSQTTAASGSNSALLKPTEEIKKSESVAIGTPSDSICLNSLFSKIDKASSLVQDWPEPDLLTSLSVEKKPSQAVALLNKAV